MRRITALEGVRQRVGARRADTRQIVDPTRARSDRACCGVDDRGGRATKRLGTVSVRVLALAAAVLCLLSYGLRAEPSVFPTGVTRYDPAKAYNGFVAFTGGDGKTHLIDMDGNEVHRWTLGGLPSGMIDPALVGGARGHVMVQISAIPGDETGVVPGTPAIFRNKLFGELDWNGKIVWQWGNEAPGGAARQHHDWQRLANGDTLILANLNHKISGFKLPMQLDDVIYEVAPDGKLVWQWVAGDHLTEFGFTPEQLALVKQAGDPDFLHVNAMRTLGPNHWFSAGDKRFDPDNIMICSRDANFTVIIDKATGHIVWRMGPNYAPTPKGKPSLPAPIDQISGQHDAHMIPEGLAGAGDILVFDNQGEAGYPPAALKVQEGSRVLEIDPVKMQIVWEYTALLSGQPSWMFHGSFLGNTRRLPNGNTFINEGMNGRFFQVTPKGDIVWEYVSPYVGPVPPTNAPGNWVYRAEPVPYDWAPAGAPHAETPVKLPENATFRVPAGG